MRFSASPRCAVQPLVQAVRRSPCRSVTMKRGLVPCSPCSSRVMTRRSLVPALGRVDELAEHALLGAAGCVLHRPAPASATATCCLQPRVARQPDDVAHARALAPAAAARGGKSPSRARTMIRVLGHAWRSRITSSLITRRSMLGAVDRRWAQHARQHGLAAEHVQRQVAVVVVVGVELAALLLRRAAARPRRRCRAPVPRAPLWLAMNCCDQHLVQRPAPARAWRGSPGG